VWPFLEQAKPAPRGHSVPVPGELGGAAMVIDLLVKRADELGIEIRYETGATNLILDDGSVVGVGWKHFTVSGAVKAKAVIIAAGGFAMNPEMVAEHTPALGMRRRTKHHGEVEPYILGNPNDDGLGIRLGVSAGGVARNLDQMFITAAAYPPEILLTGIIVNSQGQRFVAEDSYHSRTSGLRAGAAQPSRVPDRRRGAHGDARDAADPVHRWLGNRRRDGTRARHSRRQAGGHP
jgi:succinate dehydrogenase/fumarate reductase flavoprotein subunit